MHSRGQGLKYPKGQHLPPTPVSPTWREKSRKRKCLVWGQWAISRKVFRVVAQRVALALHVADKNRVRSDPEVSTGWPETEKEWSTGASWAQPLGLATRSWRVPAVLPWSFNKLPLLPTVSGYGAQMKQWPSPHGFPSHSCSLPPPFHKDTCCFCMLPNLSRGATEKNTPLLLQLRSIQHTVPLANSYDTGYQFHVNSLKESGSWAWICWVNHHEPDWIQDEFKDSSWERGQVSGLSTTIEYWWHYNTFASVLRPWTKLPAPQSR